jgi:hypothetical protein
MQKQMLEVINDISREWFARAERTDVHAIDPRRLLGLSGMAG